MPKPSTASEELSGLLSWDAIRSTAAALARSVYMGATDRRINERTVTQVSDDDTTIDDARKFIQCPRDVL